MDYEKPRITDHGDLAELTAGCIGTTHPICSTRPISRGSPTTARGSATVASASSRERRIILGQASSR